MEWPLIIMLVSQVNIPDGNDEWNTIAARCHAQLPLGLSDRNSVYTLGLIPSQPD